MEKEPQILQQDNILNGYEVEEVTLGGVDYYRLDRHFIFPSSKEQKLFMKSLCPNGLEDYVQKLIKDDKKEMVELATYAIEKENVVKEEESVKKEEQKQFENIRVEKAGFFVNLSEGKEYGHKGNEPIPFTAEEVGSKKDIISYIKKQNGRVVFVCSTSGDTFGYSKEGYHSEEEVDGTEFIQKILAH